MLEFTSTFVSRLLSTMALFRFLQCHRARVYLHDRVLSTSANDIVWVLLRASEIVHTVPAKGYVPVTTHLIPSPYYTSRHPPDRQRVLYFRGNVLGRGVGVWAAWSRALEERVEHETVYSGASRRGRQCALACYITTSTSYV